MKIDIVEDKRTLMERRLVLRIDGESVESIWSEEAKKLAREVKVPGFRLGNAPAPLVERHIGCARIWVNVQAVLAEKVLAVVKENEDSVPLIPPKVEFTHNEEAGINQKCWIKGQPVELCISYYLPPPTPDQIEQDLINKASQQNLPEFPLFSSPKLPDLPSASPVDPRTGIPGSGVFYDGHNIPGIDD